MKLLNNVPVTMQICMESSVVLFELNIVHVHSKGLFRNIKYKTGLVVDRFKPVNLVMDWATRVQSRLL